MDVERVRRLTEGMRRGGEPRWVSLRAFLTVEEIDPSRAVFADLFSDGASLDTGVLLDSDRLVFEFSIRYHPLHDRRKPITSQDSPKPPGPAGPVPEMDEILQSLSERSGMEAEVVSWIELPDAEAMFPHSRQIEAGKAVLKEEGGLGKEEWV